ncbi:hypothetical protein POM88_019712 [Heracleum sosnowskyi]|uniref:Uncharacterized protein n=1 Tax=Heracleum sosnowskyi TaxID=360622 RepID=A0AAD8MR41_9APIA|nr:hypothetical protein POM88_019712 [Heracleum sosnowskyi]
MSESESKSEKQRHLLLLSLIPNASLAINQAARNPLNTVFDVKRLIGRKIMDSSVKADMKLWPFKIDNTSLLNEIMRSNAIYNLSAADDEQEYYHESGTNEFEDNEINNEEQDDSDHSTDNDEEQGEHLPNAPGLQLKTSMLAQNYVNQVTESPYLKVKNMTSMYNYLEPFFQSPSL